MLWNTSFDKEAICTQGLFLNFMTPPMLHQCLCGQKLLDFIAEHHTCQSCATKECLLVNCSDSRGNDNALKQCASAKSSFPIIFSPLTPVTVVTCKHLKNALYIIALMVGKIKILCSVLHPQNAPSPISSSPLQPFTVVN